MRFLIRRYSSIDAASTLAVFRRSVLALAAHDYAPEQVRAWAGHTEDVRQWDLRRLAVDTWVVVPEADDGTLAGFIDVDANGYINMLYVDPDHARQGAALTLLAEVERHAAEHGMTSLSVHASITARPFFEHHGFRVMQVRHPSIGSVSFVNYRMVKTGIPDNDT
ncbi:GNAT family N-acetyltransferase [Bifidobacterium callitrichos]|uniref:Acetyltransferase, GNAT family n=1 Tax=Bifidobacterium callitrichos DSM 23973 TaxID=1437609 RepID=A0A087A176_9BIFI|nr:GNAT family N-acetyltransferase [Bifidobacterium callitrichos]KFI52526.1 acetyltransferase, GNAT family [Bifidobacterium callitrichos DSM 23973]